MTRVFIDMRMCYSYHMIASMAGACDLDVVILSARECRSDKVVRAIRQNLRRNSSISKSSVLSIPCRTVDAIEVVREAARSNDIIVTDSSPLAFEFLRKVGVAVNNWGEEYTDLNIFDRLDDFYRCKALQQQGINPYKPRQKDPWLMGGVKRLPEITFETVPVEKNLADMLIVNKIAPADIVVTDDAALAAACLNKGATAISFSGCVMERATCDVRVSRREVADRKRAWRKKRRRKSHHQAFAKSFKDLVVDRSASNLAKP